MSEVSSNSKRIIKNTLVLYFRMLFLMCISLYTSRVVLNALGVTDYGIYNVVGGVVALFSMLSGSLSASISRFLTFELGKNDEVKLKEVFSASIWIQFLLAAIIIILAETVGLWFLREKMVIPQDRFNAALWCYHISVATFAINLISVPYNAAIIAHEKMSIFAYISIFEGVAKLAIAFLISLSTQDRLLIYAVLMMGVAIITRFIYGFVCKRNFKECSVHFYFSKSIFREMLNFAGWNFIGAASSVLRDQGGNVILNLFFGPVVNAARGIATQVNTAISSFSANFMMALNPQITKSYASGNNEYMFNLMYRGARLSFYLLLLLSLPVILNAHYILTLWLKIVPEHTVNFVILSLIYVMCESISSPLITAMLATGNIRNYQIVVGGLQMMNLPASYILLKYGFCPETIFIVAIVISQCCLLARLIMLRKMISLKILQFFKQVYINVLGVSFLAVSIPLIVSLFMQEGLPRFIIVSLISLLCSFVVAFFIGCNKEEQSFVIEKVKQVKSRFA